MAGTLPSAPVSAAASNHLGIAVTQHSAAVVLHLSGELDVATAPALDAELERLGAPQAQVIVLDLRELTFMDSTGLRAVLGAHDRISEAGSRFGVVRGPKQVERLLSLTRMSERLEIVDRPEELLDRA